MFGIGTGELCIIAVVLAVMLVGALGLGRLLRMGFGARRGGPTIHVNTRPGDVAGFCTRCGAARRAEDRFCAACGSAL